MSRERELIASEQMRDRIADMLNREGEVRRSRPASFSKGALLLGIERHVRALPGELAHASEPTLATAMAVLSRHDIGWTVAEILEVFPQLTEQHVTNIVSAADLIESASHQVGIVEQ